jgi:hypothetical protein
LQDDEDSSTYMDDNEAGASTEGVPIAVDETIASEVAAVEATATVELADSITAAAETADDATVIPDVFEEEVNAAEVVTEEVMKEPEEAVPADVIGDEGLTQGGSSRRSDHVDSALLDSNPPTKFYVRRSRRVNIVSSDSERTPSISVALLTPRASQSESAGGSSMHVTPTLPPIVVDASLGAPSAENIQGDEEDVATLDHIPDIDVDTATEGVTAAGIIPAVIVPEVEHLDPEMEVIPSTEVEGDIPNMEGTFAQDPNDNVPSEDMADVHDSYDAVLADVQDEDAQAAIPELEATSPAIKNASPTKTGKLVSCYSLLLLLYVFGLDCIYNSASWL